MKRKITKIIMLIVATVLLMTMLSSCALPKNFYKIQDEFVDYAKSAKIIDQKDSKGSRNLIKKNSYFWEANAGSYVTMDLGEEKLINTIVLKEKTDNVELFRFYVSVDNVTYDMIYEQDRIDNFRVCALDDIKVRYIKLEIVETLGKVKLNDMQVTYLEKKNQKFRVNGYMTHGGEELINIEKDANRSAYFDVLTDVIMIGGVRIDSACNIVFDEGEEKFVEDVNTLRRIIGERGVKIWVCALFNMAAGGDKNVTADVITKNISKITTNLYNFAAKYDVYGIDFDWEYPETKKQWNAYNLIITESAKKLETIDKKISLALPPWGVGLSKESIERIDCVNLMCYDLFDERRDHASIGYAGSQTLYYMENQGFPKDKVLLSMAFYGRAGKDSNFDWPNYNTFYDPKTNTSTLGEFGNRATRDVLDADGNVIGTDEAYLDGYTEVKDRTAMAMALGYSGIMVFQIKCDTPFNYEFSLHRGIKEVIDQRA